jgi:probable phosphoglycerate mutase
MDRLIFIRHGESQHTVQGLMGGWVETPLTALGERQVKAVADHLAELKLPGVTELYTSDLKRAAQTSRIIGETLSLRPVEMCELREINTGDAAGLSKSEVAKINGPTPELPDLDWRPNENAETYREMAERVASALQLIENSHTDTAIVVGHGLSGQELLRAWLRLPLESKIAFNFDSASLTEMRINRWGERQLERLNITFPVGH